MVVIPVWNIPEYCSCNIDESGFHIPPIIKSIGGIICVSVVDVDVDTVVDNDNELIEKISSDTSKVS